MGGGRHPTEAHRQSKPLVSSQGRMVVAQPLVLELPTLVLDLPNPLYWLV